MNPYRHISYGSHAAVLVQALAHAPAGAVAELGTGIYSTPLLHWLCLWQGRPLVSFESRATFRDLFNLSDYLGNGHDLVMVDDWQAAPLEQPWAVAFVDHEPAERRTTDALRLLPWASYVVVHDTGWWDEKLYHFRRDLFPNAKSRCDYRPTKALRHRWTMTSVLSQTVDVSQLMARSA